MEMNENISINRRCADQTKASVARACTRIQIQIRMGEKMKRERERESETVPITTIPGCDMTTT